MLSDWESHRPGSAPGVPHIVPREMPISRKLGDYGAHQGGGVHFFISEEWLGFSTLGTAQTNMEHCEEVSGAV